MNRDQEELLLRVRDLERTPAITAKVGPAPSPRWAYQVTLRKVGTALHVILAAGTRTVIGTPATPDAERDLGAYVEGAQVYIVRTYPTLTEAGAWGEWTYDAAMPAEDDTRAVFHVATTEGGRAIGGHLGNIRVLDIRRYRECADTGSPAA